MCNDYCKTRPVMKTDRYVRWRREERERVNGFRKRKIQTNVPNRYLIKHCRRALPCGYRLREKLVGEQCTRHRCKTVRCGVGATRTTERLFFLFFIEIIYRWKIVNLLGWIAVPTNRGLKFVGKSNETQCRVHRRRSVASNGPNVRQ